MKSAATLMSVLTLAGCASVLKSNINEIDFGTIYVHEKTKSDKAKWTNQGNADITVRGISADPGITGPFYGVVFPGPKVLKQNDLTPTGALAFGPSASGDFTGQAYPDATPNVSVDFVRLKGRAVHQMAKGAVGIGGINLTLGQAVDFGNVKKIVGPAVTRRFNVLNLTEREIEVKAVIRYGTTGFTLANPASPFKIPAFGSVTVTIRFLPTVEGEATDIVEFILTTDATQKAGTTLEGKGTP